MEARPGWNDSLADNPHKLSHAEVLQRKLNSRSKNEAAARMDYQEKLEKLKKGRVPEEYKEITERGKKQYTSKQAFIENKGLQRQYENRSYVNQSEIDFDEPVLGNQRPRTGIKKTSSVSRIGSGLNSARGMSGSTAVRPGSAFGRTGNASKAQPSSGGAPSGIPRPGMKKANQAQNEPTSISIVPQ